MKKLLSTACINLLTLLPGTQAQLAPAPTANHLMLPEGIHRIPLQWQGDSLAGRWDPYAALLIPVTLPGCPFTGYMQFDTGSPYSFFYREPLQELLRRYPAARSAHFLRDSLFNYTFLAGTVPVTTRQMVLRSYKSNNQPDGKTPYLIGTLGADLIDNKQVMIDYPGLVLHIGDSLPAGGHPPSTGFHYAQRRILLPVNIHGKQTLLYFDTGSSAFTLLTDKATCLSLAADTNQVQQYAVNSWGKQLTAHTLPTRHAVTLAGFVLPLHQVTWISGAGEAQASQFMRMGLGGMTGNKLFIHYKLLLDTRNQQFGLLTAANE